MRRAWLVLLVLVLLPLRADAHVGSPDVFFEGDAGPYRLFVTVRTPAVIPGIATVEVRSESPDVREVTVVPMRLTGPGSELPPSPDRAARSSADPQFFTASVWLMERGSMQVRIGVDGDRGPGTLAVPVAATPRRTLTMGRGLGALLFALMVVLALAITSIAAAGVRDASLAPGATLRRRWRLLEVLVGGAVVALLWAGNAWWESEAKQYRRFVSQPWVVTPAVDGCRMVLPKLSVGVMPDHGHEMHLFLVRMPALDQLAHLHPQRQPSGEYVQALPSLPAGHYQLYADIVVDNGYPVTGVGTVDLPDLHCDAVVGDDSTWAGAGAPSTAALADGTRMVWERPAELRAGEALSLRFRVENADGSDAALEPYMGMTGHAEIVRTDGAVFAHIHPSGTVAMPALMLAEGMGGMQMDTPSPLAFPYGFPTAGDYRIFVQVKRGGVVLTGAFDAQVR